MTVPENFSFPDPVGTLNVKKFWEVGLMLMGRSAFMRGSAAPQEGGWGLAGALPLENFGI